QKPSGTRILSMRVSSLRFEALPPVSESFVRSMRVSSSTYFGVGCIRSSAANHAARPPSCRKPPALVYIGSGKGRGALSSASSSVFLPRATACQKSVRGRAREPTPSTLFGNKRVQVGAAGGARAVAGRFGAFARAEERRDAVGQCFRRVAA